MPYNCESRCREKCSLIRIIEHQAINGKGLGQGVDEAKQVELAQKEEECIAYLPKYCARPQDFRQFKQALDTKFTHRQAHEEAIEYAALPEQPVVERVSQNNVLVLNMSELLSQSA